MANRRRAEVRSAVHKRIRRKVRGTTVRPRLAVYRSLNHIYAQIIDDEKAQTLVSASTIEKDLRGATGGNVEAAQRVGRAIAERALSAGISSVVFDRGGYLYHGRVRALTDAARAAGLNKEEAAAADETAATEEAVAEDASAPATSAKEGKSKEKKSKEKTSKGKVSDTEGAVKTKAVKKNNETTETTNIAAGS